MIPLAQWLAEKPGSSPPPASAAEEHLSLEPLAESLAACGTASTVPERESREAELAAALQAAEGQVAELSRSMIRREQELRERLGDELARQLEDGIRHAFAAMLATLEEALEAVLAPFLVEAARGRAIAELKDLLNKELRETDTPVIAIRAAPELHEALEDVCRELAPATMLTEGDMLEVVFTGHRQRFEDMSARWRTVIGGAEP